jgi:hypothetical protein
MSMLTTVPTIGSATVIRAGEPQTWTAASRLIFAMGDQLLRFLKALVVCAT